MKWVENAKEVVRNSPHLSGDDKTEIIAHLNKLESPSSEVKEQQGELWDEVYREFQDIFDYRQSKTQRDKWFEEVKKQYTIIPNQ